MKKLEPSLPRFRLIIEGKYSTEINEEVIREYLTSLTETIGMRAESEVFLFSPNDMDNPLHHGLNGFIGWIESGCHIYTWDTVNFFTVDLYSCKEMSVEKAVEFTKDFFKATEIVFEEVNPYD